MTNEKRRTVVVLFGATASGKTQWCVQAAERFPIEVINADSRQVFRRMDIGTAKPTAEEQSICRHHCIDIRNPDEKITAGDFSKTAREILEKIPETTVPVIAGGTGLYIQGVLYGLPDEGGMDTAPDEEQLYRELYERSINDLYKELQRVDPSAAERYADRNPVRILRALRYYRTTRIPISQAWKQANQLQVNVIHLGLHVETPVLNERIRERCTQMFDGGLIAETQTLLEQGIEPQAQALRTIGYRECVRYLAGDYCYEQAVNELNIHTRRYAKRQRTWMRGRGHYRMITQRDEFFGELDKVLKRPI